MLIVPLPLKALLRDWRSGELTLLALALIVAVTCVSALNHFSYLINTQLNQQAAQLLGADRLLTSSHPIPSAWKDKAQQLHLQQTSTLVFLSMSSHEDALQLAQIKAVQSPYPLLGKMDVIKQVNGQTQALNEAPPLGKVWVAQRILSALSITIGDTISIGAGDFTIDGILIDEPGQGGDWFNISPKIIMNWQDIGKTAAVQPGSNLTYSWLVSGDESALRTLDTLVKSQLNEHQQWLDSNHQNSAVQKTINNTLSYLKIGTLMSLLLAGVAISLATFRFSQRHQRQVAVLRCFGANERQILTLYAGSMLLLGIVACFIGVLLGYALQPLLIYWLKGLLPELTAPFSLKPALLSFSSGLLLLISFTLFNLLKLRKVTAISIFREQSINWQSTQYVSYCMAFVLLGLLAWFYTNSWSITLIIVLSCLIYIAVVIALLLAVFNSLAMAKRSFSLNWRFGFANIARNMANSSLQIIGIGLALTAILTLTLLRLQLISDWQRELPAKTANYFIINIEPVQVKAVQTFLQQQNISSANLYPLVRGRVVSINRQSLQQMLGDKLKTINALQRELNFSWSENLPDGNQIAAGNWPASPNENWVSVEQELAKKMGLKIGDQLEFRVGDTLFSASVSSIRRIVWTNFKPNFFMLFNPKLLKSMPQTYITSLYLPNIQQNQLLQLNKQFPNVSIIDINAAIQKIKQIVNSAGKAISLLALFGLLAGIIITALAMLVFSDSKLQETQVLKVLGMRRYQLAWIRSSESFFIGLFAGILSTFSAIAINYYLAVHTLGLTFTVPWLMLLLVPVITALSAMLLNHWILMRQYAKRGLK